MCGIAGFAGRLGTVADDTLKVMGDSLAHRGPDAFGTHLVNSEGQACLAGQQACAGLVHRRLSIIDLSDAAIQPMSNEDEKLWIVFNGECYNYQPIVKELKSYGHTFLSNSDTEALLHGYEEWGIEELLSRLNGMFAFGLWDQKERQLILARDRIGKKPLYYTITPDGSLFFASEIKALVASGFVDTDKIDPAALVEFWLYGYTAGERTLFQQIKRLEPASYAIFKDGKLTIHPYWDSLFSPVEQGRSLTDYCDELEELLLDAIRLRLISDVPVGVFLSSGIDSSLIAALTARITDHSIESFSIGFANNQFDESHVAQNIARRLNIANSRLEVNADFAPYFSLVAKQFDELFGDSSAIPTFFVCREAKKHVTVVLTGDAGDELFAGYDSYAKALSLWGTLPERWLVRKRTSMFQAGVDFLQLGFKRGDERYSSLERVMPLSHIGKVFQQPFLDSIDLDDVFYQRTKWYQNVRDADLLSAFQYLNMKTYLPDDILVKVDRMSMYHALECRSPFLDYRIVEFASKLPFSMKIGPNGEKKYLLRRLLSRYLGNDIINRPKMGFSVPWSDWCTGRIRENMVKQWETMDSPYFQKNAASYLFPSRKPGWPARQWNAYCTMNMMAKGESSQRTSLKCSL